MGVTLTLPAEAGVIVTIFLALFISCVGLSIWSLLKYGLHEWRSTPEPRDAFHHQQQLLLRSDVTDWKFVWRTLRMTASHWRSGSKSLSPVLRSVPLAVVALVHALLIATASVLSSKLTHTSHQVLVTSSKCGLPVYTPLDILTLKQADLPDENAFYLSTLLSMQRSVGYTNACYRGVSSDVYTCDGFVRPQIKTKVNTTEECPFTSNICTTPAVSVDTGYLDSDSDLGLNAPSSDRIGFRKKLTCAPINADNYTPGWTTEGLPPKLPWDPDLISGAAYKFYYFGEQSAFNFVRNWTLVEANFSGSFDKAYQLT